MARHQTTAAIVSARRWASPPPTRLSSSLTASSYIGINVSNATTGGMLTGMVPPALGGLAEAVVFFLPSFGLDAARSGGRCRPGRS
jgi:hypothetical protein